MSTPLVPIQIRSIYKKNGDRVPLPARMAKCAPDMLAAIRAAEKEVEQAGGNLYLSDLFRSYEMQIGSHIAFQKMISAQNSSFHLQNPYFEVFKSLI